MLFQQQFFSPQFKSKRSFFRNNALSFVEGLKAKFREATERKRRYRKRMNATSQQHIIVYQHAAIKLNAQKTF